MTEHTHPVSKADVAAHAHYMKPLDGIRGAACLLVIASHIIAILHMFGGAHGAHGYIGALGVVIFFTLSGFLMSTLYVDEKITFDGMAKYIIARFARIAPAYWIAIFFAWFIYLFIPDFHYQMTPFMMARSVVFGGNQGVFWSIPPEIQFYVYFLFLWYAWAQCKQGNRIWLAVAILLCIVFIATNRHWGGLMLPSKLQIFLSGFLAAYLPKQERIRKVIGTIRFQLLSIFFLVGYAYYFTSRENISEDIIFPVLIGLWIAGMSISTKVTAMFETDTMRMMGAASFSIYLFHDPILFALYDLGFLSHTPTMANVAIMSVIALIFPVMFHVFVEKHLNVFAKKKCLALWAWCQEKYPFLQKQA